MKTPIDAAAAGAGATAALLNSGAGLAMVDLWKITLNGGSVVIRWHGGAGNPQASDGSYSFTAAASQPTAANGTYLKGPPIDRGKISTKLGLQVATLEMTVSANASDLINGKPLLPFAQNRGFDGATVVLYRAFLPSWAAPITGLVTAFSGRVTALKDVSRSQFTITVSAWTVLLNVNMGPDVYQAGCLNTHYDANCGLTPTLGTSLFNGTVAPGGITTTGFSSSLTNADHFFDKGRVIFTSGANTGLARAVKTYLAASGALSFAFGFPTPPAPGDAFQAERGCLLTLADCEAQRPLSDAQQHFRGYPFTPPAIQGVLL
jgi:hypothetical protein